MTDELPPLRPEVVDLLFRLDPDSMRGVWRDLFTGDPFTAEERKLAGSALVHEVRAAATRFAAYADQVRAHADDTQRLSDLLQPYWAEHPGMLLGRLLAVVPAEVREEALALIQRTSPARDPDAPPPPPEGGCGLCADNYDVAVHRLGTMLAERDGIPGRYQVEDLEDELVTRLQRIRDGLDEVAARGVARRMIREFEDRHLSQPPGGFLAGG